MANEDTQAPEDTSWWAFDAPSDSEWPPSSFDQPLEWPEVDPEAETDDDGLPTQAVPYGFGPGEDDQAYGDLLFPPVSDPSAILEPERAPMPDSGYDVVAAGAPTELHLEPLPDSIWAADPSADGAPLPAATADDATTVDGAGAPKVVAVPTFYAEADRSTSSWWPPRFQFWNGNAAVFALIAFASLVLLGMFLSVRGRNDVTTESQPRVPTGEIAATRPVNTIPPPTTTATTAAPPPSIALSDLLPPSDDAAAASPAPAGGGTGPARTGASATTSPPSRSAAPSSGGGSGSGGGGSTPQSTATTAAPAPDPEPPPPPPPADTNTQQTTQTTRKPPSTATTADLTQFSIPTPTFPVPTTAPTTNTTFPKPTITWPPND